MGLSCFSCDMGGPDGKIQKGVLSLYWCTNGTVIYGHLLKAGCIDYTLPSIVSYHKQLYFRAPALFRLVWGQLRPCLLL